MKYLKRIIVIIAVAVVICLILIGAYSTVTRLNTQDALMDPMPEGPQIQILSPQENTTYQVRNIPLNITANNATTKITYFIEVDGDHTYVDTWSDAKYNIDGIRVWDGDLNGTYTEPREFNCFQGVHTLYVYAFDEEGNVGDCQIITFTVAVPVPPEITMNRQKLQAAISYFESEGLTIEPPNPKAAYLIHGTVVNFESAAEFAASVKANGILTIVKFDEAPYVSFCGFGSEILPTVYCFKVVII